MLEGLRANVPWAWVGAGRLNTKLILRRFWWEFHFQGLADLRSTCSAAAALLNTIGIRRACVQNAASCLAKPGMYVQR